MMAAADQIRNVIRQELANLQMGGAGGAGGAGGPAQGLKPKIDVNQVMLQILKILARICDALQIQIPASEMVVTGPDLNQFAATSQASQAPQSAIQPPAPIEPMGGAAPGGGGMGGGMAAAKTGSTLENGRAFDVSAMGDLSDKATAILQIKRAKDRRQLALMN